GAQSGGPDSQAATVGEGHFSQVFGAEAKTHFQNPKVPFGWGVVRSAKCLQCKRSAWAEPTQPASPRVLCAYARRRRLRARRRRKGGQCAVRCSGLRQTWPPSCARSCRPPRPPGYAQPQPRRTVCRDDFAASVSWLCRSPRRPGRRTQRIEARLLFVAQGIVEFREGGLNRLHCGKRGLEAFLHRLDPTRGGQRLVGWAFGFEPFPGLDGRILQFV